MGDEDAKGLSQSENEVRHVSHCCADLIDPIGQQPTHRKPQYHGRPIATCCNEVQRLAQTCMHYMHACSQGPPLAKVTTIEPCSNEAPVLHLDDLYAPHACATSEHVLVASIMVLTFHVCALWLVHTKCDGG